MDAYSTVTPDESRVLLLASTVTPDESRVLLLASTVRSAALTQM